MVKIECYVLENQYIELTSVASDSWLILQNTNQSCNAYADLSLMS
jgi:hypothetical protein